MSGPAGPELAFDHVAIPITHVGATLRFYSELLGLSLIDAHAGDDWGGMPWLMMIFAAADERQLAFIAFKGAKISETDLPRDARHYAFSAASPAKLTAWKKRLESANVKYSVEDHGAQQSIYFEDPNGVMIEIAAPASAACAAANARAASVVAAWLKRHGAEN